MATRTAHKPLVPFSADHFKWYTSKLRLDHGDYWQVEDFQLEVVEPIFAGVMEVWTLLPQGNAKSTLMAGLALYHCDYTVNPWVPVAASSRDQAEILARQAYGLVRNSPGMEYNSKTGKGHFKILEGYRSVRSMLNGGNGIKVYAADVGTADGIIPTLAMCDEGHRHDNLDLYRLWVGKLRKRRGQILMSSTAGEPGSEFEEQLILIRERASKKVRLNAGHVRYEGPGVVMNEWKVQKQVDARDMQVVKQANPLSTITEADLQESHDSLTFKETTWLRYTCNIAARMDETAITEMEWDENATEDMIPKGRPIEVGADFAWKHDTTAIVPLYTIDEWMLIGKPAILMPPGNGEMLSVSKVKQAFRDIHERNPIVTVVMDMSKAEDIAQWIEDEIGAEVIDRPQGNAKACEDYEDFMLALRSGYLMHTGDEMLKSHVLNAIARAMPGDRTRFDRPSQSRAKSKRTRRVIDGLTAAAMIVNYQMHPPERDKLVGEVDDYRIHAMG